MLRMALTAASVSKQSGEHEPGKYFVCIAHLLSRLAVPRFNGAGSRHSFNVCLVLCWRNRTSSSASLLSTLELWAVAVVVVFFFPTVTKRILNI